MGGDFLETETDDGIPRRECPLCGSDTELTSGTSLNNRVCTNPACRWEVSRSPKRELSGEAELRQRVDELERVVGALREELDELRAEGGWSG